MSHILRPDNPTQIREITYAKWCAIWQNVYLPEPLGIIANFIVEDK